MPDALVIGAGPAGLMAAQELAAAGCRVVVAEAKPSPARKFLMAGKSGLNITRSEELQSFAARVDAADPLHPMLASFGPAEVADWCRGLGQEVFTGSSGRVFPVAMKASPLLRAWLQRLERAGVTLKVRWRWVGFEDQRLRFETPEGIRHAQPDVTVLALGGASWARLGSDGAWVPWLVERGVAISPFLPSNMGFEVAWSLHMARHFGQPLKGVALCVGAVRERGEVVVSARGIEGGGIYAVSRALRDGGALVLDLMPDVPQPEVAARLARMREGETLSNRLRKLGLSPVAQAMVMEFGRRMHPATAVKSLPVPLLGPRPMDEAISTAGGVTWGSVTPGLELRALPGTFVAGEMLDWDAPTGGYLLTTCLATGRWAGRAAVRFLANRS